MTKKSKAIVEMLNTVFQFNILTCPVLFYSFFINFFYLEKKILMMQYWICDIKIVVPKPQMEIIPQVSREIKKYYTIK